MKARPPKYLRDLARLAERQGWRVGYSRGDHVRLVPPDKAKPIVFCPATPSDHRARKNLITQLRASGLRIPRSMR